MSKTGIPGSSTLLFLVFDSTIACILSNMATFSSRNLCTFSQIINSLLSSSFLACRRDIFSANFVNQTYQISCILCYSNPFCSVISHSRVSSHISLRFPVFPFISFHCSSKSEGKGMGKVFFWGKNVESIYYWHLGKAISSNLASSKIQNFDTNLTKMKNQMLTGLLLWSPKLQVFASTTTLLFNCNISSRNWFLHLTDDTFWKIKHYSLIQATTTNFYLCLCHHTMNLVQFTIMPLHLDLPLSFFHPPPPSFLPSPP